mgnify:FL=1|tara:strand:- start:253 stop:1041 length:789 start_codon:yes stop_codon:yes gene_type:complete
MLSVQNLEVVYQDVILVLKGISINLPKNKVVALLGANGAGKTTVLRAISGLLDIQNGKITKGEITYGNDSITNSNPSEIVKMGISQVLEGRRIFSEITVIENLKLGAHTNTQNFEKNIDKVFNLFPILKSRKNSIAGYLSGGEQQMLAIGRSLMSEPDYLLLDEPSLGLAPKLVDQIAELVLEINNLGVSVLLVEQNANMALNVSDHAYIMENGSIVMDKDSKELKEDEDVQEFYLGLNTNSSERKSFRDVKHYKRKKRWLS